MRVLSSYSAIIHSFKTYYLIAIKKSLVLFLLLGDIKQVDVYSVKCEHDKIFKILFCFVELPSRSSADTFIAGFGL